MTDSLQSSFASVLHTNFAPSAAEYEQIRADLAPRLVQLESLNTRIRELSAERDKLQAYIDSHAALISYPRRLPVDIIRDIFVACLPTDRSAVMSAQEAPLLVSRICSAWRTIALTTPSLWASIHIPIGFALEKPDQRIPAISDWLQRSGVCPISLSLSGVSKTRGTQYYTLAHPGAATLMKCLSESVSRWMKLELRDLSEQVAQNLADMILNIQGRNLSESSEGIAVGPALRQLRIFQASPTGNQPSWNMHPEVSGLDTSLLSSSFFCGHFTHLSLESWSGPSHGLSTNDVLRILSQCPRLISFAFLPHRAVGSGEEDSAPKPITFSSITLSFLESFAILGPRSLTPGSVGSLLGNLVLPALRQLHILTASFAPDYPMYLIPLFGVSALLETLQIDLRSFTTAGILQTLEHFLNLIRLTIFDFDDVHAGGWGSWETTSPRIPFEKPGRCCSLERFLCLLTPTKGETTVCPKLQMLEMRNNICVPGVTIQGFLRGRAELASGFRRLEINWSRDWEEPLSSDELEVFQSRGIELDLLFMPEGTPYVEKFAAHPRTGLPSLGAQTSSWYDNYWQ